MAPDPASVREFLRAAESQVRRDHVAHVLKSIETLRAEVGSLTLTEAFAAYQYEESTFNRASIMRRLRQHMAARSAQIVKHYFDNQHGVENDGS